jgi:hypothetical protein
MKQEIRFDFVANHFRQDQLTGTGGGRFLRTACRGGLEGDVRRYAKFYLSASAGAA